MEARPISPTMLSSGDTASNRYTPQNGISTMNEHSPADNKDVENEPSAKGSHDGTASELMTSILEVDGVNNPHNWPLHKKVHASAASSAMTFAVAFGITGYTAGLTDVVAEFDVSMTKAIAGMSIYLFGIFFAPIYTPHLSERFGRSPIYLTNVFIWGLFILGAGYSKTYAALIVCRFFAGFFGGATLVLIEGTFADVWGQCVTSRYYSILTMASYIGAACGPLVCGFVIAAKTSWRWTQWVTLMIGLAAYLLGIGIPETYPREILRRRAARQGIPHGLEPALSGVTIAQMAHVTIIAPLKVLVTDPIVIMITFNLALNFAVLFQFFITVPVALSAVYSFKINQIGLAFISAIVGSLVAVLLTVISDIIMAPRKLASDHDHDNTCMTHVEFRMWPAILGNILMLAACFWVGWTASPEFHWAVPVVGTGFFVCGSALVLIAMISYLFDAYSPRGTLAGLTAAACLRVAFAGWLPLVIVQIFNSITPKWGLGLWGFLFLLTVPIPVTILIFGFRLRERSAYRML
ncbi:hypothetical protein BP6252_10002 [Coleophoma cylindrospora]|uniref:Major facilitator superfamily (MFS) profile domain-containing protein n=1 Tax=Coleophoma cylindrospora TaxID=1849047 RepID=A0A3D8QX59_9HELO|nr:hypothetical protein BP6252_10002 [Coleophoma cylindrospora]